MALAVNRCLSALVYLGMRLRSASRILPATVLAAAIACAAASADPTHQWQTFALTGPGKPSEAVTVKDRVTGAVSREVGAVEPWVGIDRNGEAVAVWQRLQRGDLRIESSASSRGGSWSTPVRLSGGNSTNLHFADVANGRAIAVWQSFARGRSTLETSTRSHGGGWSAPVTVSSAIGPAERTGVDVAVDGSGKAVATWVDRRHGSSVLRGATRSAGGRWSKPERISAVDTRAHEPTVVLTRSGEALVTWSSGDLNSRLLSAEWTPRSRRWSAPARISSRNEESGDVQLSVDRRGEVVAVWIAYDNDGDALATASRPPGGSWSKTTILDGSRNGSPNPELAVNPAGEAIAVWERESYVPGIGQEGEAFYLAAFRSPTGHWTGSSKVVEIPYEASAGAPAPSLDPAGEALVVIPDRDSIFAYTHPKGGTWSEPKSVFAGPEDPAHPNSRPKLLGTQLALSGNGDAVALWQTEKFRFAKNVAHFYWEVQGAWHAVAGPEQFLRGVW